MLGKRIKERRKAAGLTQTELGDAVGVRKNTVSDWERGKYKPDIQTVDDIAHVLRTRASYLLGYDDDDPVDYDLIFEDEDIPLDIIADCDGDMELAVKRHRAIQEDAMKESWGVNFGNSYGATLTDAFEKMEKPSAFGGAKGDEVTVDEMRQLLCNLGYIRPGEDLRAEDLDFMTHLFGMLDAWFASRNTL